MTETQKEGAYGYGYGLPVDLDYGVGVGLMVDYTGGAWSFGARGMWVGVFWVDTLYPGGDDEHKKFAG